MHANVGQRLKIAFASSNGGFVDVRRCYSDRALLNEDFGSRYRRPSDDADSRNRVASRPVAISLAHKEFDWNNQLYRLAGYVHWWTRKRLSTPWEIKSFAIKGRKA